jgi:hypothetical protein
VTELLLAIATYFFCVDTLLGQRLYVMFFLEHATGVTATGAILNTSWPSTRLISTTPPPAVRSTTQAIAATRRPNPTSASDATIGLAD